MPRGRPKKEKKDKTPRSDTSQLLGSEDAGEVLRRTMEYKQRQRFATQELRMEALRCLTAVVYAVQDVMREEV